MFILLLTLLAVALVITVAGLLLSPRNHASNSREMYYAGRGVRRTTVGMNRQMRVRRSQVEIERRAWANILTSFNVGSIFGSRRVGTVGSGVVQTPWLGILLVLLAVFASGVYALNHLLPNSAMVIGQTWPDAAAATPVVQAPGGTSTQSAASLFPGLVGASKALLRISQLDPAQYNSSQDYNTWAYSACSAAAMTEVINSYGHNYRVADILKVEANIGEITPALGLIEDIGIQRTVVRFGFKATYLTNPSLDTIISIANSGRPVIVSFPPARWDGGHILIVRGGNKDYVYMADSSRLNMQAFTRDHFMKYWAGFAVVVVPNNA